jgi:multicomponent Na+:H+ antiporter subunit E
VLAGGMALTLFGFWLVLSGHYTPFLIGMGAGLSLFVVWFAWRLRIVDSEGFPIRLLPRMIGYWAWLLWQIVKSAFDVMRIVLDPRLPISPVWVRVRSGQDGAAAMATYANSITLTPGTVTVDIDHCDLLVHALTRPTAEDLAAGEMDARVSRAEGARA